MKTVGLFFGVFCTMFFISCKKNNETFNTDDIRIIKTGYAGSGTTNNLDYDNQGRIVRVTRVTTNQPTITTNTVTYNGNEINIKAISTLAPSIVYNDDTKFITDGNKRPQQRIQVITTDFGPPSTPQRDFKNDTTYYEYNAAGQLTRATQFLRDSTWYFSNAVPQFQTRYVRTVANYSYNNGNLSAVNSLSNQLVRSFNGVSIVTSNFVQEDNYTFGYNSSYANKTDFSNALVLNELNLVAFQPYFLNPAASLFHNNITHEYKLKDGNGILINSSNSSLNYTATYNQYGFLSGVNRPAIPNYEITYNR
jgi:hypothetical protein